jgi:uncharacterized membrane protein
LGPAIASPRRHAGRRAAAPWLLGFILAVIAGAVVNALPPLAALTLGAPLYLLAAVLPAIGVVAYALAETKTARQGVAARAAYGGCVATTIAMLMELVLLVFVVVIVYLVLGATPEGREAIDAVSSALQAQSAPGAPETVDLTVFTDLLRQPAVLLAAFAVLGFLGPLIEESAKVGIVALRVPPLRSRAWVWGVAAGAGFGTIEAMALGTLALQAWPMSMVRNSEPLTAGCRDVPRAACDAIYPAPMPQPTAPHPRANPKGGIQRSSAELSLGQRCRLQRSKTQRARMCRDSKESVHPLGVAQ